METSAVEPCPSVARGASGAVRPWWLAGLLCLAGCAALTRPSGSWTPPAPLDADPDAADASFAPVERQYAAALAADEADDPRCLDLYVAVAQAAWPHHAAARGQAPTRASAVYAAAVRQLLTAAPRLGRWRPQDGIALSDGTLVPADYEGFARPPEDFQQFAPVGDYATDAVARRFVTEGIGVAVVASRDRPAPFQPQPIPFAATAVLCPVAEEGGAAWRLVLYDPLHATRMTLAAGRPLPLASDTTAPLGYRAATQRQAWLGQFLRPQAAGEGDKLAMLEPYQPGKIPLVLVHGLLSDPSTWSDMINELRSRREIVEQYQIWAFGYATGEPFLVSASVLRSELARVRAMYDPAYCDPALGQMVLVGHSMGGLVAKLQATFSGDLLWNAAATRPFAAVQADATIRANLRQAFFFEPSPDVARVVFVGTPHGGASLANRALGRLGSALVAESPERRAVFDQLNRDNPGLLAGDLRQGIPTSVEMLEPASPLLAAINALPYRSGVELHTILGSGRWSLGEGPSDGVVTVASAGLPGVRSELAIDARHEELPRRDETVREVVRILKRHARGVALYR
jgi:pimeloyl-ACP methyl ester carboxylesterase